MKIFVGADHNGYQKRRELLQYLKAHDYHVVDDGDRTLRPDDDFPVFAQKVIVDMQNSDDQDARGLLLCSSGQGMCMAANRFKGIRAAVGYDREAARSSRNDDDSNILCLPASHLRSSQLFEIVEVFLNTAFAAAPRYKRRIAEMDNF